MVSPMIGANRPTVSEIRAPKTTRASSSRPSASVPSQCSAETGARRSSMSMSVGLGSGSNGARIAAARMKINQPMAAQNNSPRLRVRRLGLAIMPSAISSSSVAMADPRIEHGVEHVDNEIDQHIARGHAQHDALQDNEIAGVDRAEQQAADTGQCEDRLHDHRAAHQAADVDAGDGDQRQ